MSNSKSHHCTALWICAALASLIAACMGYREAVAQGDSSRTYTGTMTIRVGYEDGSGTQHTFRRAVTVVVGPPMSDGTARESNPLNLFVSSEPVGAEGDLLIQSATVVRTPYTGRPLLLQCWDMKYHGGNLSGTLTETHEAEACNLLFAKDSIAGDVMDWPFPIAPGAKIQGTLDSRHIRLIAKGRSTGGSRVFACLIEATI